MKYFSISLACSLLLAVLACDIPFKEKSHDFIMQARIAKFDLAEHNFTLGRKERRAKSQEIATDLSKEYPAAAPFSKDTTDRIFVAQLPKTIRGYPLDAKKFEYQKPLVSTKLLDIYGAQTLAEKAYFTGMVRYIGDTKRGKLGTTIALTDYGYTPEWAVTWMFNNLFKGEGEAFFGELVPGFELEKTVDYKGHRWAVWVPSPMFRKIMEKTKDPGLTIFISQWNNRFLVMQVDRDTVAANLEAFHQVVNVPWLDKLHSPEHQKHVMPD